MILIIGYGNTLRSDDGVGQYVVQDVSAQHWPGVRSIATTQLAPELAAEIAQAAQVIFVDAILVDAVQCAQTVTFAPQVATLSAAPCVITHHATPQGLLGLARSLYDRCPSAVLVSVPGVNFELGETLSQVALQNAAVALQLISSQIAFNQSDAEVVHA
jgi:hydrogenase maturation protease